MDDKKSQDVESTSMELSITHKYACKRIIIRKSLQPSFDHDITLEQLIF